MTVDGVEYLVSRYTMQKHIGRKLKTEEMVHHIDGNPENNDIKNLQIVSRAEHKRIHDEIGIKTRFKKKYTFNNLKILRMYRSNTIGGIAKMFGCSEVTIRRIIKKYIRINLNKNRSLKNDLIKPILEGI